MKRVLGGEIGEFAGGACYWMQGILWHKKRQKGMTDLQYQMRNWYNYTWLCGDHIVEQHIHNIDVLNWAAQTHPAKAIGMGYRTRTNPDYGHIYDFFAVDYIYPNGAHATMTAILGRMATYSGRLVQWDEALASELVLAPERLAFDALPRVLPDEHGRYPHAIPGVTPAV
jgi:hypothetical protein